MVTMLIGEQPLALLADVDAWTKISAVGTLLSAVIALIAAYFAVRIAKGQHQARRIEIAEERALQAISDRAKAASLALAVLEDMTRIEATLGYHLDFGKTERNLAEAFVAKSFFLTESMRSYMTRLHELGEVGDDVRRLFARMINTSHSLAERAGLFGVSHPDARDNDQWINESILKIRDEAYRIYQKISPRLMTEW